MSIEVIAPGRFMHHVLTGRDVLVIAATIIAGGGIQYTIAWYDEELMRREDVVQGCELDIPERGDLVKVSLN